ncbi:hypothetical protein IF2G_04867 [Cordyceps javanica]|nr:hypothetical protein IF2G_04867 [Cordyceps javanica]
MSDRLFLPVLLSRWVTYTSRSHDTSQGISAQTEQIMPCRMNHYVENNVWGCDSLQVPRELLPDSFIQPLSRGGSTSLANQDAT